MKRITFRRLILRYVDKRDEKLKKEHAEIETLWKDISAKLDALSNWHYRPKPPQPSINVVADVPTISMEDARPTAGGDVGGISMLAPQRYTSRVRRRARRM
jgi:U3 small nucleolar RNA-associated protein MPP10